jgi:hypothetical protein
MMHGTVNVKVAYKQSIYRIHTAGNICNYITYCADQVLDTDDVHTTGSSAISIRLFPLTIVLTYINIWYILRSVQTVSHNTELCRTVNELSAIWCVLVDLFTWQVHGQPWNTVTLHRHCEPPPPPPPRALPLLWIVFQDDVTNFKFQFFTIFWASIFISTTN